MSFEDIARKIAEKTDEKPRIAVVDETLDLGRVLTATDYIEKIKKVKELKKILQNTDSMNLYKRGWRFQLGTSKEWAGLCSAVPSEAYQSKQNKNLFASVDFVRGDDNWKNNMKSTIYHEIAHGIVREIFFYPESPSNTNVLAKIDPDHWGTKGHGKMFKLVCDAIVEKGVICTTFYHNMMENDLFKKFRYICNICGNKGYGKTKFFASRCTKCQTPVAIETNII